jgi:hypothetical protein
VPALNRAGNRHGNEVNTLLSNNWRTSPVPAPAVIPAPGTYFEVAAVKTLVVEPGFSAGDKGRWPVLRGRPRPPLAGPAPPWALKNRGGPLARPSLAALGA